MSDGVTDDAAIEAAFGRLLTALNNAARGEVPALWATAHRCVLQHFSEEERAAMGGPHFGPTRSVRTLLAEHAHLRQRLADVHARLPVLSSHDVQALLAELRAHARSEARTGC